MRTGKNAKAANLDQSMQGWPSATPSARSTDYAQVTNTGNQTTALTGEVWIDFDPILHTRKGWNLIQIKARDIVTGFNQEKDFPCK